MGTGPNTIGLKRLVFRNTGVSYPDHMVKAILRKEDSSLRRSAGEHVVQALRQSLDPYRCPPAGNDLSGRYNGPKDEFTSFERKQTYL